MLLRDITFGNNGEIFLLTIQMSNTCMLFFFLIAVFAIMACTDIRKVEFIRQAEQMMQEQPDSSLHLLQTIDRHTLRGETLARYALVYSIAQDKSGLDVSSDSLLRIAYEYYCLHPEDSLYARSQYYMGKYYTLVDSTKQAEDCLRLSIRYAEERKEYYTQYLALDRLSREIRYSDAPMGLMYSKQALDIYSTKCSSNIYNKIYLLKDVGKVYMLCNKDDSALYYMDLAFQEALQLNDSSMISRVMQDMSLVHSRIKDYQQALSLAKEAWRMSPATSLSLAFCLASCYSDADSIAMARDLYTMLFNVGNYEQRYLAFKDLAGLSAKEHGDSLFQIYSDSAFECMEAIYKQQLRTKAAYYNDVIQLEEEKVQREKEKANKKLINWFVVMLIVVGVIIGLAIYNNIRYRARRRLESERERHLLQEEFAREQHKRELAYKESQISLMRSMVMERCLFRRRIDEQKKSGKHITLTPGDWKEISDFLNATSDNFLTRLTEAYPNLREKDYQFCMLVRLGFPNKDLANIYGIAEVSVKQKMVDFKERLKVPAEGLSFKQFISKF